MNTQELLDAKILVIDDPKILVIDDKPWKGRKGPAKGRPSRLAALVQALLAPRTGPARPASLTD